ncbi:hypothetical protein Pth03_68180 [Planotetraspora thailandica]|uniref:DUF4386 domain-containing protein n=1 Tax=Planotetraspora thailandica TaxID=487172 RepID=A0A8J3Y098_9ACTN|nr:hypothetical protein [Planotetraspora thailandica]GII58429.1 hypothetical protein Pth03_68180 [Planotetraspora thailandica]
MTYESPIETAAQAPVRQPRDVRGFWRVLLAVIAPLPLLGQAFYVLLNPLPGGGDFAAGLAKVQADQQVMSTIQWLNAVFVIALIPAAVAVAWVARRGAPRLATAGAVVSLLGFLAGFGRLPNDDLVMLSAVRSGLDHGVVAKLDAALWEDPVVSVASGLWILGLTVGLALLGAALWRSRVAPAWTGIALMIAGPTHPFLPGQAAAAGLVVGAVGFAGASLALLRMRNDEFDLPPAGR